MGISPTLARFASPGKVLLLGMIWLNIVLIIIAIALMAAILVQSRSAGISSAFGGGAEGFHIRRGSEKRIFQLTIVLSILFLLVAAAHLFIK